MMLWLFVIAVVTLLYTYVGFPALVGIKALLWPRRVVTGDATPSVTVLVAAHNEAHCILDKIDSLLACDYPEDLLQIVIVSDGSTDGTDKLVTQHDDRRVQFVSIARAGKAAALNRGLEISRGDVLIFTDANSIFAPDAIRRLGSYFYDTQVGAVAGNQRYQADKHDSAIASGEKSYWRYDRLLKQWESRAGNTISATGAIYAIRRDLVDTVPEGVTDDFAISTGVIEQGYRLVFAEDATAFESVSKSSRAEFRRKVRIMTRGFRSVWLRRKLLNPFRFGFYSLQLFSHKILRRLMVFPLVALLISSLALWSTGPFFQAAFLMQACFYALACLPLFMPRIGSGKWLSLPYFFSLANLAAAIAFFRSLTGRRVAMWETARSATDNERSALSKTG